MSSLGSSERATPSTTTMVFCSSSSSGRVRMSNRPVTSNSSIKQLRHRDVFGGAVVDRLADGADRLREALDRMMPRHIAGLEMHLRRAVIVAGDEAEQDLGEEPPFLRAEPSHDAEVDRHQPAVVVDEQVAGMHVGVKEAVAQRVAQEGLDHRAAERRQIEALGFERGAVVSGVPSIHSSVSTSRAVRSQSTVGTRKSGSSRCSPPSRRARPPRAAGPFRSRPSGASVSTTSISRSRRASGEKLLGLARGKEERVEIGLEAALDAGPQHLHRHRLARAVGLDLGAMHLRDRGGGDRRARSWRRRRCSGLPKRGDDRALRLGLRERRHLVLQALEIARDRHADHVRPRRQELAELDVGRPEPGERGGKPA